MITIFNKYDSFIFEQIDSIFNLPETGRGYVGSYQDLFKENQLPELSHWFAYF